MVEGKFVVMEIVFEMSLVVLVVEMVMRMMTLVLVV